jgi:hypothetical protein
MKRSTIFVGLVAVALIWFIYKKMLPSSSAPCATGGKHEFSLVGAPKAIADAAKSLVEPIREAMDDNPTPPQAMGEGDDSDMDDDQFVSQLSTYQK